MTINFYLDKKQRLKKESTLFAYIRGMDVGTTIKVHTQERIDPKYWDADQQKVRRSCPGAMDLNAYLNQKKAEIHDVFRELAREGRTVSPDELRECVKQVFTVTEAHPTEIGLFGRYEEYIATKALNYQRNSLNKHKTIIAHLKAFEKATGFRVRFDTMGPQFTDRFSLYMLETKNVTNNTYGKYITAYKTFLSWALERGFHANTAFKRFTAASDQTEMVTLTYDELERLHQYDFSANRKLAHVRDVFCFQCFTGQRYGDVVKFNHQAVRDGKWHLRTVKTRDILPIPLQPRASEIVERYRTLGRLPTISIQKANDYLKEICAIVGLNDEITIVRYRGNERIEIRKPKHQLVSTHTARRTFVTLSLERGMRPEMVMKVTGHKDYKTFKRYIRLTESTVASELMAAWA